MERNDARKGARSARVALAQSPYHGRRHRPKEQKQESGGLWSFIKSWSFFGQNQDSNMEGDPDSDDESVVSPMTVLFQKLPRDIQFIINPDADVKKREPSPDLIGQAIIKEYDDLGPYRMPGALGRSQKAIRREQRELRLAKVVELQANCTQVQEGGNPPPEGAHPERVANSSLVDDTVQELASAQVARFQLSKAGKPLTVWEFEQIRKVLKLAVAADSSPDGISLQSDPVLKRALEQAALTDKAQATEAPKDPLADHPYQGTVITSHPFNDIDEIIPQRFGLEQPKESAEKGAEKGDAKDGEEKERKKDDEGERFPSPKRTYGLPPFERPEDPHRQPSPEPVIPQAELDEDERLRAVLDDRAEAVRRYLHLDEDDDEVMAAWDELERWKGLKYTLEAASDSTTSTNSSSGTSRGDDDEVRVDPAKMPEQLFDYNKGYTPSELMVNPYERLSAFKNRKTRRKVLSADEISGIQTKRAAKEQATRAKAKAQKAKEARENGPRMATDYSGDRPENVPLPPIPRKTEITLGILHATGRRAFHCALPYDEAPTKERPVLGDWITSGETEDGLVYQKAVKRKAVTLHLERNGILMDPPAEGRPRKRRRSSSPEPAIEDDPNLKGAIYIAVGIQKPEGEERALVEEVEEMEEVDGDEVEVVDGGQVEEGEDDEEMVDETPEPPPAPPVILTRASPARRKPRPRIRPVPDANRPKHFQYSPINPSPLRVVSAFDSPKQASVEVPPEAVPPKKEIPLKDEESYTFSTFEYRLGAIGPVRTSEEMVKARLRASERNPYTLPDYKFGSGKHRARFNRGFKHKMPKGLRKLMKEGKMKNPVEDYAPEMNKPVLAKELKVKAKPAKPSTADLNPDISSITLEGPIKQVRRPIVTMEKESTPVVRRRSTTIPTDAAVVCRPSATIPAESTLVRRPSAAPPVEAAKLTNGTRLSNGTIYTDNTKLTNGTHVTNDSQPSDINSLTNSTRLPTGIRIVNGVPKPTDEPTTPPARINYLAAMVPGIKLGSRPSKRKFTTSTSSSDPLIHSLSTATNPMTDDIPPLRLPVLHPRSHEEELAILPPPMPQPRRLREGPTLDMRRHDWAAAGIRPTPTVVTSPRPDWKSLPPITNAQGIWSCNNCQIGNVPDSNRCWCCGLSKIGCLHMPRYAPTGPIVA